ncbi:MAG: hypothetical protein EAZ76_19430 [Nostocales cyanobacterium]|nr:MAG: hypothetical protein EAZ76_19430 [Nostocales cyanobacterium]
MEAIQIPDRYRSGFEKLLTIDSTTVNELIEALRQAPSLMLVENLASLLESKVEVLTAEDIE